MNPMQNALAKIVSYLEERGTPYMIIGGIANLTWGVPRSTLDIDLTVWAGDGGEAALAKALTERYKALPPNPADFVLETRVLPLEIESFRVDVIFGELPFEEQAIKRANSVELAGVRARVCTPEDLIAHKVISDRPRDKEDIRGVIRVQGPKLDRAYLDPLVRGLSEDLSKPAIWEFYSSCWAP